MAGPTRALLHTWTPRACHIHTSGLPHSYLDGLTGSVFTFYQGNLLDNNKMESRIYTGAITLWTLANLHVVARAPQRAYSLKRHNSSSGLSAAAPAQAVGGAAAAAGGVLGGKAADIGRRDGATRPRCTH